MSNETLHNPHDHFFRHSFSYTDVSVPFFQRYLPAQVREALDFTTLSLEPGSFVDSRLVDHHTDLLFSIRAQDGRAARLSLLLEHKSYNTPRAGLQLLDYLVQIWSREAQQSGHLLLTPVIGVVLYHGETAWTGGRPSGLQKTPSPALICANLRPSGPQKTPSPALPLIKGEGEKIDKSKSPPY